jgi:hypothetical protein
MGVFMTLFSYKKIYFDIMMNIKLNAELMRNSTQVMQGQQQVTDY